MRRRADVQCLLLAALAAGSLPAAAAWADAPTGTSGPVAQELVRARQQEDAGQHAQAVDAYQRILAADPRHVEARLGLATSLAGAGRIDESVRAYQALLAQEPNNARAHLLLGEVYLYHQRKYDEALEAFSRAALTGTGRVQVRALEQTGDIAMLVKRDWDMAAQCYRRVLLAWPEHAKTHFNLGGCLANQGHLDEAITEMDVVLKLAQQARDPELATRAREAIASIRARRSAAAR